MNANSSNIGLESAKFNDHYKNLANGQNIAGNRHQVDYFGREGNKSVGRHGSNPTAAKNLSVLKQ